MRRTPAFVFWIPRITGIISLIGSAAIIFIIMSDRKRKLARPKNRLMLLMSTFDVIQSAAFAFSSLPFPREQGVYGAIGSFDTFRVQIFVSLLGMAVPLYNASLSLLYLLTIRYNVNLKVFSSKIEPILHTISIIVPLSMSILIITQYWETITSAPPPVTIGYVLMRSSTPAPLLHIVIVAVSFTLTLFSMISISYAVIDQQNNMMQHNFSARQTNRSSILRTKETVRQALLYSLAFILTHIFPFIMAIIGLNGKTNKLLNLGVLIFYPLQGFWNFVLYIRLGVKHLRRMNPEKSLLGAIREVVFNAESVANSIHRRGGRRLMQTADKDVEGTVLSNEILSNSPQSIRRSTAVSFGKYPEEKQPKIQQLIEKDVHFEQNIKNQILLSHEGRSGSGNNESFSPSNTTTSHSTRRTSLVSIASFLLDKSFDESLESYESDHHDIESDMPQTEVK